MDDYLDSIFLKIDNNIKLDKEQKEVILDNSKNTIVLAGAGSGKTTVITAKVKYLVDVKKINCNEILIISFTNKAILELRKRINEDFNLNIDILTFHSFAYKILKELNYNYKVNLDLEKKLTKIIKNNMCDKQLIKMLSKDKVYKKNSKNFNSDIEYFIKFTLENIQLFRMTNKDNIENSKYCKYYVYLTKILQIYNEYKHKNKCIDFEDMIIVANDNINNVNLKYKYIIVDEFQDISYNRYLLLKNINKKFKTNLFVVGDDWQAIYSFAGSDNNIFLNFEKQMNAKLFKITSTYRNSKELIDIAGNFVMKNNKQIKKKLTSFKHQRFPVVVIYYKKEFICCFEKVINMIVNRFGDEKNILVLGRYKKDLEMICGNLFNHNNSKIIYIKNKKLDINFMTIHSSKGLGFDNVILINSNEGNNKFPNIKKETKIRRELLPDEEKIYEERRLFYVAMTRTKNNFYIICTKKNRSVFVKEIEKNNNVMVIS